MTANGISVERDAPVRGIEPFAGMYWRIRTMTYLLGAAMLVMFVQGYFLFRLSQEGAAHVYEIHPDGETLYVGEREANLVPRRSEVLYQARVFVERLMGWNSSSVHRDVEAAVNMTGGLLRGTLEKDIAESQFIHTVRERQIRSELVFDKVDLLEMDRHHAVVRLDGRVDQYGLIQYDGEPLESKPFALDIVMSVVPREPTLRPAGLEIVRLTRRTPTAAAPPTNGSGETPAASAQDQRRAEP